MLMFALSKIDDLKFVGSCSLYLQGIVDTASDIDVLVQSPRLISEHYELTYMEEPVYKFPGRQRAYFIENGIMVDVYIQPNSEETVTIEGHVCSTVQEQIRFLEKTLPMLKAEKRQKTMAEINFLKSK